MASFQAKIGWKMPRKRKNKNYQSIPFLHDAYRKFEKKKIAKKLKKFKNSIMASFQAEIRLKRPRMREKIKIIGPFCSYTTRNRKFQ